MARGGTGNVVPSVVAAEHIGPEATGDNIEAKRVALYVWDPLLGAAGEWKRYAGDGSGGLTDAQLRASPVPVSQSSQPLPTGASTSARQDTQITSLIGIETDTDYRYGGGKTAFVTTLAASGGTTLIDPAPGNAIRVFWVAFIPNSDNTAANLIKVGFGTSTNVTTELYRGYAMAHWEVFSGTANQNLNINAETAEPVAVTIHYQEYTP